MRILVTGRGLNGLKKQELGIFELDQAKALMQSGHDVRFAAVDTRSVRRLRPWGSRVFEREGIKVYYSVFPMGNPSPDLSNMAQKIAAEKIWKTLTRDGWKPEIIHSHFGMGFSPIAKREGIPLVYTEHFSGRNRLFPAAEAERLKKEYSRVSCLLAVGSTLAENIYRNTGIYARVEKNIADVELFSQKRQPWVPHEPFRFAAAGDLIYRKGYDLLLEALARIRDKGINAELTVFGGGKEEKNLRRLVQKRGLATSVEFHGRSTRQEMAEGYRSADAFILPSRLETFGVVYIEAMAAGLPVIATRCGGPEDFVDETNGILVPTEDVPALADAMERMIRTRENYDSAAIAATARARFSPATIAGDLTKIYEEILSC